MRAEREAGTARPLASLDPGKPRAATAAIAPVVRRLWPVRRMSALVSPVFAAARGGWQRAAFAAFTAATVCGADIGAAFLALEALER